jgi:histone deacetylase complex subunit SAP18
VVLGDDGAGVLPVDAVADGDGKGALGGGASGRAGAGVVGAEQADTMLKDVRFVIGDYIAVAILPPLASGSVAPMPGPAGQNSGMGGVARGGRAVESGRDHHHQQGFGGGIGKGGAVRENGFGFAGGRGSRGRGGGWGGNPGPGGPRGVALPSGEWRRGEKLPDGPPGAGGRGGYGGGRGRDRW